MEEVSVDALEIFRRRVLDRDLSALSPVVDAHLGLKPLLEAIFQFDDRCGPDPL